MVDIEDQEQKLFHCLKYWIPLKTSEIYVYAKDDIRIKDKNGDEKKIEEKPEGVTYKKADLKKKNVFLKYVLPTLGMVVVPIIVAVV